MNENKLLQLMSDFAERLSNLENARIHQSDIVPDAVKQRHMGEANRFIRSGLEKDLPIEGEGTSSNSTAYYFCTDSNKLKIWNGTSWVSTTLS
jgi:hypothetical protein